MAGVQEEVKHDGAQRLDPLVLLRKCATAGLQKTTGMGLNGSNDFFWVIKVEANNMSSLVIFEGFPWKSSALFGIMTGSLQKKN